VPRISERALRTKVWTDGSRNNRARRARILPPNASTSPRKSRSEGRIEPKLTGQPQPYGSFIVGLFNVDLPDQRAQHIRHAAASLGFYKFCEYRLFCGVLMSPHEDRRMARLLSQCRLLHRLNWLLKGVGLNKGPNPEGWYRWMQIFLENALFQDRCHQSLVVNTLSTPYASPADSKLRIVDAVVK
jgi:hypothetical protein